ncbi:Cell adhesion molecule 2-like 1 [Homarus americanus]|uniref:Cell adhesion molecule 2-like 1 n=1 Tax=Homarus americanus TaxID=6706 RepID=A0A8J5K2D8_HOMAM|nr:Cell adhesion molecule 2-like 1 [Homarus americanus]
MSVAVVMVNPHWLLAVVLLVSLTLPAPAKHTGVTSVWVVTGGRAELPCPPAPKMDDDQPVLVLWYLSSNTLPVYSYDAREGEFGAGERWSDPGVLGERAFFTALAHPPTLVLEHAHAHDQGVYTCRIDYRLSPSTTYIVNLTVIIPPGPPVVLWGGLGVVGGLGPLREDQQVKVVCRSVGGRPPPQLTWWWRGSRLPNQVTNTTVDPNTVPPLDVRILGSGGPVSAGAVLRLVCRAVGSHPPAEVTWWRAHSHLTQVSYAFEEGGNVTTATLTVMVDRDYDGATLACTAANPLLNRAPLTHSLKLQVYYTPVVRLSLGNPLDGEIIKEGDDVYFECTIRANPAVHRVDWYHNGAEVVHNVSAGVVVSGLSLVIRRLRRQHSGSYTCAATNMEGRNSSNAVHLTVRHSPVCAGGARQRTQGAARGTPAVVTCRVEAKPALDVTWAWVRRMEDGSERPVSEEDVRKDGLSSSVVLTPLNPGDYGQVLCSATNTIGRQREPCMVTLVPAGPPDPPSNCTAAPVAHTKDNQDAHLMLLAVTCHEGFDGGLPQDDFPEWVVVGLEGGVGATLRVAARNARGRSDTLRLEVHTASAQHRAAVDSESAALGVPTMLGAVVGVAVVLLLLLVVSVVIARHACPRKSKGGGTNDHTLVKTPTGSEWDCYDPTLVSPAQRRHPSLHLLANSHGQRESLVHVHADTQTPSHIPTKTHAHMQSQTPHSHLNGQIVNCRQQSIQVDQACRESDSTSHWSSDSEAESVVEVDLTAAGRSSAAGWPRGIDKSTYTPLATGDLDPPTTETPLSLPTSHSQAPVSCQPHTTDGDAPPQPPTKDSHFPCAIKHVPASTQRIKSSPKTFRNDKGIEKYPKIRDKRKLVRFSDYSKAASASVRPPSKVIQGEVSATSTPLASTEAGTAIITVHENGDKNSSETSPPPKPPRTLSHTIIDGCGALPAPEVSSYTLTGPSGHSPLTSQGPHTPVSEDSSQATTSNPAPLAEDEVRDAYSIVRVRDGGPLRTKYSDPGIMESSI